MTCRNLKSDVKTEGKHCLRISSEGTCLPTERHPALRRRELDSGICVERGNSSCDVKRKPISGDHEGESIEAHEGGGSSYSSEEVLVMGMERRG
jgi:hypothetical protein